METDYRAGMVYHRLASATNFRFSCRAVNVGLSVTSPGAPGIPDSSRQLLTPFGQCHSNAPMKRFFQTIRALSLISCCLWLVASTATAAPATRHILFFSKSSGFEHSAIKCANGQMSFAAKVLEELARTNHFEFTLTKDGTVFTPENIAKYDAFFFYTTGDLTGKGRVFYTSMGHREDVWTNTVFQQVLLGGINWAVGNAEANVKPNLKQVTPQASVLPSQN